MARADSYWRLWCWKFAEANRGFRAGDLDYYSVGMTRDKDAGLYKKGKWVRVKLVEIPAKAKGKKK